MGLHSATMDYAIRTSWMQSHLEWPTHATTVHNKFSKQTRPCTTVIIQPSRTLRECILTSLQLQQPALNYTGFDTIEEWQSSETPSSTNLIALWPSQAMSAVSGSISDHLRLVQETAAKARVVIVADIPEIPHAIRALREGAAALVPVDTPLQSILNIFDFVRDGGTYVPASLIEQANASASLPLGNPENTPEFSPRQLAVAKALSRGASNKVIAYELAMCESTVKVHIRTIMKKLKARNRTQVAIMMQNMGHTG